MRIDILSNLDSDSWSTIVGTNASFSTPMSLALDKPYLYVTDTGNNAIRRIDLGIPIISFLQIQQKT
jgi:hypothetical protein